MQWHTGRSFRDPAPAVDLVSTAFEPDNHRLRVDSLGGNSFAG